MTDILNYFGRSDPLVDFNIIVVLTLSIEHYCKNRCKVVVKQSLKQAYFYMYI